jgi:hypothetical protein
MQKIAAKERQIGHSLDNITPSTMVMYIDDGNLWISSYSLLMNTHILQAAYYTIKNQLAKAGLSLDVKKCELIHFTKRKKDTDNLPSPTTQATTQPQSHPQHISNGSGSHLT